MTTLLTAAQVQSYLADIFPQFNARITALTPNSAILELLADDAHLRPGGTVSGPTLMALADAAMYVAILGNLGQVALAVRPPPGLESSTSTPAGSPSGIALPELPA